MMVTVAVVPCSSKEHTGAIVHAFAKVIVHSVTPVEPVVSIIVLSFPLMPGAVPHAVTVGCPPPVM